MPAASDYYALLGVARDATAKDIKRAFRAAAKECHPDVAGDDPEKTERFKMLRAAYEVLADPVKRAAYDRRLDRRANPSPFYGSHWKHAGKPTASTTAHAPGGNDLDLEDLFNDFGGIDLGFGKAPGRTPGHATTAPHGKPPPQGDGWYRQTHARPAGRSRPSEARAEPSGHAGPPVQGDDVKVKVDVPAGIAMRGGLVTVTYVRLVRGDDLRAVHTIDELHELRVPPGVREGEVLRVERHGHAGPNGGPYGDLVATVHIVGPRPGAAAPGDAEGARGPRMRMPASGEGVVAEGDVDVLRFDVGVVEAILGGRVEVDTPQGRVRVTIPPGTSSGTRLRLRARGNNGHDGAARDLYAEVRIVVPAEIDEESRRLIEEFGRLNPGE
ncbi:MAG: J domain-containing protein [Deltaproteobacteria bacterium]|nr:J domain-containing protein [Deltaproteobacteria bacterium]